MSINKHVNDEDHLYKLLGEFTKNVLYFEGNVGTDKDEVIKKLTEVGFKKVIYRGVCSDDMKKTNNNRPLLFAYK